jgi:hypothetical protein
MEPMLLVGLAVWLLVVATLLRVRMSSRAQARPLAAGVVAAVVMVLLASSVASATHTEVTTSTIFWFAPTWNGYKVYLSAPTHSDSGSRGECGWEENINGRYWNSYAASVNTGGSGSLYDRGYYITVSGNARDNSYPAHVTQGNNWGANVYITTHTNASGGCGNSASYVLTMYRTGVSNSVSLASELQTDLHPVLPGGQNSWNCDLLYECTQVSASHRAYVELFFHTNTAAVSWFQNDGTEGHGGVTHSWRYGYAVDVRLGYPR